MAEPKTITVKAQTTHRLVLVRRYTDTLTGEEWELLHCPECGRTQKMQWEPYRKVIIQDGKDDLTEEDAAEITRLCKEGQTFEAQQMMAREPGHAYVRVPTEDEMREMARAEDREAEFEEMVEQAIIDGVPLLTFGMSGARASTWPKGCGPVGGGDS